MPTPPGNYDPSKELWESNTIVSASKPGFPGQQVYIAGGTSVSGAIPVAIVSGGASGGGGGDVNITSSIVLPVSGTVAVSSSQVQPIWVTGSVQTGLSFSGSISPTPVEAYPNTLENLQFARKTQRFDLTSDSVNYIGFAVLGASDAAAVWTIKRLSFDVSGNLETINWSGVTASWTNRLSEVYS